MKRSKMLLSAHNSTTGPNTTGPNTTGPSMDEMEDQNLCKIIMQNTQILKWKSYFLLANYFSIVVRIVHRLCSQTI